ncbi:ciliogenesis-associated TTC17-interacting protein [Mauremys reevesii]|uniref:ciliogenesis-associated TTC17-interacting protein n=1 Tax=Mauremys reevesii TaxID=260615 RepID=UPI00193FE586|nr:ciliogenesis-associated TTC17-interacting protein [Mauremys reevesii]XP_039349594.1 ciliogenesis-associated TTC17-interacting protein [Mauremys reevesii]XP_039349595.1 ciliogenesis-associated TTC17-interacting protein [Mauremys reevesii]
MDDADSPAPVQRVQAASEGATEFLSLIGAEELSLCLFAESLVMVSESGQPLGHFSVSVQPACYEEQGGQEEDCYLVRATSQGTINEVPCGSSITAYVSKRLETLEQHQQEYVKFRAHPLDRKTHIVKRGDRLVVTKIIEEGEHEVQTQSVSYNCASLHGLISEAANLLVLRVLARRRAVPQNTTFLAFDTEACVCTSTYAALGFQKQRVGVTEVEVFVLERAVCPDEGIPMTWQFCFLSDGHLARRVQVGSPVTMLLQQLPVLIDVDEVEPRPVFEKKPLDWEEDVQLYSQFLDRKEELQAGHTSYARRHPELRALLADFLQLLLLHKPDDVLTFAAEFFAPFASQHPPGSTFRASGKPSPFRARV